MRTYIQNIFGTYTPTSDGFGGADWEFIAGVIIFCIILHLVIKLFFKVIK